RTAFPTHFDFSRGFGPNTTPPPLQIGDDLYPARARPVPFCRHGFAPDKSTSALLFVLAEPERLAARMATTASCTACVPRPSSIRSIFASFAAALLKTFALISSAPFHVGFSASSPSLLLHAFGAQHVRPVSVRDV